MAFSAADVRVEASTSGFLAVRSHLDPPLECRPNRACHLAAQVHEFTGIGPVYTWHRTGAAQVARPGRAEQLALFLAATAVIVAIEILTFCTGWGFHILIMKIRPAWCGTF